MKISNQIDNGGRLAEAKPYDLMDGATGESLQVIRELDEQRKISADADTPIDERLEAY
jgi:hypothetical protein